MHAFRKPTPAEWLSFMAEVERLLGQPAFDRLLPADEILTIFHGSVQACGEGASPQSFANVIKGRLWLQ